MLAPPPRQVCATCRRPAAVCYCPHLVRLGSRTRVVFLQHPREARVAIGTARMAHLMLENSELHRGVCFDEHPRVQALAADPGAALLFPGPGSLDPTSPAAAAVRTLVVVDGTWQQARKVLRESALLRRLPRLGLLPARPGNYRIRREPAPECLATIEAVSQVLGALDGEGDRERFAPMLAAFTYMVDEQLARARARAAAPRRRRVALASERLDAAERDLLQRAVLICGEVNAQPREAARAPARPELLHLVAQRLGDGASLELVLAPRRPLAAAAAARLGLSPERLQGGEAPAAALARLRAFLRPGDVLCGWGHYTRDVLALEAGPAQASLALALAPHLGTYLDLRGPVARRLQRSPGAPAQAAAALDAAAACDESLGAAAACDESLGAAASSDESLDAAASAEVLGTRAARTVATLARIARALLASPR